MPKHNCDMPFCTNEPDSEVIWKRLPDERGFGAGTRSAHVCASCWTDLMLFLAGERRGGHADA